MKRVLMIAWHFPPIGGPGTQRTSKYCKYLPAYGWQPTVIAGTEPEEHQDETFLADLPPGLEVYRLPLPQTRWRQLRSTMMHYRLGRIATWLGHCFDFPDTRRQWSDEVVQLALTLHKKHHFDALYTTSYWFSACEAGRQIKQATGLPWVADLRDPWSTNGILVGHEPAWAIKRHERMESACFEAADRVVSATAWMTRDARTRYPEFAGKFHTITNGFDPDDRQPPKNDVPLEPFHLVNTGSYYGRHSPATMLRCLESLGRRGIAASLKVSFVGGIGSDHVPNTIQTPIHVLPRVLHDEVLEIQRNASGLLLNFGRPVGLHVLTGKLFEYLISGRPIFACIPTDSLAAEVIRETKAGVVYDCDRPDVAANGLLEWIEEIRSGQRPETFEDAINQYSRRHLASQLAELLREVASDAC